MKVAEPTDSDGRPDPSAAGTAAEFVDALRRLKNWSGMGFRRLEQRAAATGQVLPRSTITSALHRNTLPREDLIVALVRACGEDQDKVDRWVSARRRIAAAQTAPSGPAPVPPATPEDHRATVTALLIALRALIADAQTALRNAIRLYDELVRIDPEEKRFPLAPAVSESLDGIGVDFGVPEADLRDRLIPPDCTSYFALAHALIQSGWRLNAPVNLDVIWWNYTRTPDVAAPRHVAEVRPDVLKAAILQGYNARHGTRVEEFEQILK
ncbi:hypothetical protein AB0H63_31165 [Micromonospora echinospora]|uniref:hypothetical protein n=1 Tax=Micromonospora echinospora TaxID=1877 RepID=UPI0033F81A45